jgi:hypothetical protein
MACYDLPPAIPPGLEILTPPPFDWLGWAWEMVQLVWGLL